MTVEVNTALLNTALSDLVIADPRRSRVLERYGLDYCCNGHVPLSEAASAAGIDVVEIAGALDLPVDTAGEDAGVPAENAALAHDIVDAHHAYMWEEMPRLAALVDKVHTVHGERHPELAEVHAAYHSAVAALDPHMTLEERVVFPAISRMEKSQSVPADSTLTAQITELRAEHDVVGDLFKKIRQVTDDYTVPGDACASYTMMLKGLQEMEHDLHEHIHKENNILFPRVVELADRLR